MKKLLQPFEKLCFAWVLIFMTAWSGNVFAQVTAIQVAAQAGTLTYGTAGSVTYLVSFNSVNPTDPISGLTVSGLPAGATSSWSATSSTGSGSVTLTVNTSVTTPAAVSGLTVSSTTPVLSNGTRTLTVGKKDLTITASMQAKLYGATFTDALTANTALFSVSGLVNGNTVTGITLDYDTAAESGTTAAFLPYKITPTSPTGGAGFNLANYNFIPVAYNGSVGQRPLTITASPSAAKIYGDVIATTTTGNPADWTAVGLQNMETIGSLTLIASANASTANAPAGSSYTITPANAGTGTFVIGNYAVTYVPYTNTVAARPISLRPNNSAPTKTYGQVLGVSIIDDTQFNLTSGSYAGTEQATGLTVTPNAAGISALTIAGDNYGFTPSLATGINGFLASNYDITYLDKNNLVVSQAPLVVTVTGPKLTYGSSFTNGPKTTDYTITGLVNGNTILSVVLTASPAITSTTPAGTLYTITPGALESGTGFIASNYNLSGIAYSDFIAKKAVTITPKTASFPKVYGDAKAATVTGVAISNFDTTGTVSGTALSTVDVAWDAAGQIANSAVGTSYVVTPSNAAVSSGLVSNYDITYIANTAGKVAKRAITLTAGSVTAKQYGDALPVETNSGNFTLTTGTYAAGETATGITLTPNTAGALATTPAASPYLFTASGPVTGTGGFLESNYAVSFTNAAAGIVTPAPLKILVDNRTKCQGTNLVLGTTAFTIDPLTPLKNGDQVTAVVLTSASGNDSDLTAFGSFTNDIGMSAPSGPGFVSSNYTITQNKGNLDITAAPMASVASVSPLTTCKGVAIVPVTFTTTNATGIGTPVGLPAGLTAVWNLGVITISGTPTSPGGASYTYTIPLIGCDMTKVATGVIILSPEVTVTPGPTTAAPATVCNGSLIPSISHTVTGVSSISDNANFTGKNGLPNGVGATLVNGVITISGTPNITFTAAEELVGFKTFNYSITLTGSPCSTTLKATGSIRVNDQDVPTPKPANATICQSSPMVPLLISTKNATGIGTATGLPIGITAAFSTTTGIITISGSSSSLSGAYAFTIPLTGGCGAAVSATGTITIGNVTVSPASSTQAPCSGTVMTNITHSTVGATAIANNNVAGANGLPPGVKAVWASTGGNLGEITISGTPTGPTQVYNYSISLSCGTVAATGTISVVANTVSAGTTTTGCQGSALTAITHTTTGATGIGTATGLPAGVTATWAANVITISGTPTVAQAATAYSIPLIGGCGTVSATGTIGVTAAVTIGAASTTAANCSTGAIAPVTHTASAPITGIVSTVGLPAGITATASGSVLTIAGTPTGAPTGSFPYTVVVSGSCGTASATGTITFVAATVPTIAVSGGTMISSAVAGNQWYTCAGVIVPGATSNVFNPAVVGSYKVKVTTGSCVVESACASVTLLAESFDSKDFSYYPNPVKNELFLSYSKDITSVKVINVVGQVMSSSSNKATSAKVDMSSFPAGLYLVEVKSGDESKTVKVIKH